MAGPGLHVKAPKTNPNFVRDPDQMERDEAAQAYVESLFADFASEI